LCTSAGADTLAWTRESKFGKDDRRYGSVEPGPGISGAQYQTEEGVAPVGTDTWGPEVLPSEAGAGPFEVHQILLPLNDICILENMSWRTCTGPNW
jgi:kynurenine formamidase